MALSYDPSVSALNRCGCCGGIHVATPVKVSNAAGLAALAYRIGTQSAFLQSMLGRLSSASYQKLQALTTRQPDDLTIAFLDACAVVDDVLTFYAERYANENYLRTATERFSLAELARLIGYQPKPGVAASAWLAFTIEDTPGTPETVTLPAVVRVQSIPGPNELPQAFETSAELSARSVWNAMKARSRQTQPIDATRESVVVKGIDPGIRAGDRILFISAGTTTVKRVIRSAQDTKAQTTTLFVMEAPTDTSVDPRAPSPTVGIALPAPSSPSLFSWSYLGGSLSNDSVNTSLYPTNSGIAYSMSDWSAYASASFWPGLQLYYTLNTTVPPAPPEDDGVYVMRQRASVFGHNAPKWDTLPQTVKVGGGYPQTIPGKLIDSADLTVDRAQFPDDWDDFNLDDTKQGTAAIDLDNVYGQMIEGGWLVLEGPTQGPTAYKIRKAEELSRSDYTVSAKLTRLTLNSSANFTSYKMRRTAVFGQSEKLTLADLPLLGPVSGNTVTLDAYYPDLKAGQTVILTGERTDLKGVVESEAVTLSDAIVDTTLDPATGLAFTRLVFTAPLKNTYLIETVVVNANVASSTNGESVVNEVLGSGDARQRFQRFYLRQTPLTYVTAEGPTGTASSLSIYVDGVRWKEVPSLYGLAPDDRAYIVRHQDDGKTYVQFARPLPTGTDNVVAFYRKGIGTVAMVKAGQLSLLAIRPLGVRSVVNPLAASGAQDREDSESIRSNAPLTVLTMGRLVSLTDYQDFARSFAGFSKALATPTLDGGRQGIFVTVAGATVTPPLETDQSFTNLASSMKDLGDPFVQFQLKPYTLIYFQIEAGISIDANYQEPAVIAAVQDLLRTAYSFENRGLGQSVSAAEVTALIQSVPGVIYVDLDKLFRTGDTAGWNASLTPPAPVPGDSSASAVPAGLLVLDPRPTAITPITEVAQ